MRPMRRVALTIAVLALAAPAAAYAQAPPLRAKLSACVSGPAATDRTATFTGSMPTIKGTKRMWMRFDLQQRSLSATTFATMKVPGLGVWQKSAPGKSSSGFVFTQRVQALAAPGAYRALVRFRWYGKGGKLLRSTTRQTGTCTQPDQRPNLRADALDAARGPQPGEATYNLLVRNDGRTDAGPFDVGLEVAGARQPAHRVAAGLAAAAEEVVAFVGPRCAPGSTLRFTLDAGAEVAESVESDDVVERACPFVS
jgi:CARDB protein